MQRPRRESLNILEKNLRKVTCLEFSNRDKCEKILERQAEARLRGAAKMAVKRLAFS